MRRGLSNRNKDSVCREGVSTTETQSSPRIFPLLGRGRVMLRARGPSGTRLRGTGGCRVDGTGQVLSHCARTDDSGRSQTCERFSTVPHPRRALTANGRTGKTDERSSQGGASDPLLRLPAGRVDPGGLSVTKG